MWDEVRGEGNPTRSLAVKNLIKRVKKHKVRHTGSDSQARRPVTYEEMLLLLNLTTAVLTDRLKVLCFRAMLCLQWQLIARVDDMQKV